MPSVQQGRSVTLEVRWYTHEGGPPTDVTGLEITITPTAGGAATLGPTDVNIVHLATGWYSYLWTTDADLAAVDYASVWTADGMPDASETITVTSATAGSYATPTDLADYIDPVPANAASALRRASRDVDRILLTSVYDTADAANIAALTEATCEQAAYRMAQGDSGGLASGFTKVKIGSVDLTNTSAAGGVTGGAPYFSPLAFTILQLAGLTSSGPDSY